MSEGIKRKLTTILCADARGYSRLMDDDEVATLATLKSYREAMYGLIDRHQGRLVNTAGDGLLAEFASVVEAVQCAAEIQRELAHRNTDLAANRRMDFRIGINLGDVMIEGDDLFGEGVNIASRLEGLAPAGGICISGTAYDQVRNKLSLGYEFIGQQTVKNIAEEIPVYRVNLDADASSRPSERRREETVAENAADVDVDHLGLIKRDAVRCGFYFVVLLVINLVTSPGYLWSFWVALALLIWLGWKAMGRYYPDVRRRGVVKARTKIGGDHTIKEDTNFRGRIGGDVRVRSGVRLKYRGKIGGDLILEPGSEVEVDGKIGGDVINQGGRFKLKGKLGGSERQEPGEGE